MNGFFTKAVPLSLLTAFILFAPPLTAQEATPDAALMQEADDLVSRVLGKPSAQPTDTRPAAPPRPSTEAKFNVAAAFDANFPQPQNSGIGAHLDLGVNLIHTVPQPGQPPQAEHPAARTHWIGFGAAVDVNDKLKKTPIELSCDINAYCRYYYCLTEGLCFGFDVEIGAKQINPQNQFGFNLETFFSAAYCLDEWEETTYYLFADLGAAFDFNYLNPKSGLTADKMAMGAVRIGLGLQI